MPEFMPVLSPGQWALVLCAAFVLGLAKAGLKGIDLLNVTLMALVFGGRPSTGIVLPLLCFADILAVSWYNRHAQWTHVWRLLPWMAVGILAGVWAGNVISEAWFTRIMAGIILFTIAIMLRMEWKKRPPVPRGRVWVAGTGLMAGFATMLGNLAGAFANLYFLAMQLPKNHFIGTAAWIFLIINLFKLPFQVLVWRNINRDTLLMDLWLLPALLAGFFLGVHTVARMREAPYRSMVIWLTLIGALFMLLRR